MNANTEHLQIKGMICVSFVCHKMDEYGSGSDYREIGMELWKMLQNEVTFDDLLKGIMEEYDVDKEVAKEDIQDFLDKLIDGGILTEDDSTESR